MLLLAAVLLHGSETSKDGAIERLIDAAVSSGEAGTEQARMFRSAVVAGGAVPIVLTSRSDPPEARLAAIALASLD